MKIFKGRMIFLQRRAPKIPFWKSSLKLSPRRQHKAGVFSKGALMLGLLCPISLPCAPLPSFVGSYIQKEC